MAKNVFNFKGTDRNKFMLAGANYTRRCLRSYSEDYEKLLRYTQTNFEQVCSDGCSKGFCYGKCMTCPVQTAYKNAVEELMRRAVRQPKQTPKERLGKSWEQMRQDTI